MSDADSIPPRKPLNGPSYRDFIKLATLAKPAERYLEIGVHNGSSLTMVDCKAIGVDPEFVLQFNPVTKKPALFLFQMTSDDYFATQDTRALLGGDVDVAFLDGMHLFEYLLRDFINTEKLCAPNSLILLDDCLPVNVEMTERDRRPEQRKDKEIAGWWTGDVWKVVIALREYRPDLVLTCVDVQPTGSIVVTNLDPASTVLSDAYDEIVARFIDMELTPERFEAYWQLNAPMPVLSAAALLFPHIQFPGD